MRSKRFIRDRREDWLPEMAGQHYCLRWNNYQSNMTSVFHHLLRTEAFVDVTLACNEESLKAHKVVLSACSSYFQKLLMENPCKHPTIIMPQDVCFSDLKFIIEFVYRGEIDVSQAELQSLLKTADQLKIKGLCEVPDGEGGGGGDGGGGEGARDAVCAEVTPLPPDTPHTRRFTAKLRSGTRHAAAVAAAESHHGGHHSKRRFDARRQIYRESRQMMSHHHHHHHNNAHSGHGNNQDGSRHNEGQGEDGQQPDCITVGTSTDDDKSSQALVVYDGRNSGGSHLQQLHPATGDQHSRIMMTSPAPIMSTHSTTTQVVLDAARSTDVDMPEGPPPAGPTATLVSSIELQTSTPPAGKDFIEGVQTMRSEDGKEVKVKFETLRAMEQGETLDIDSHMSERGDDDHEHSMHTMMITPELLGLIPPGHSSELDMNGSQSDCGSSVCGKNCGGGGGGPGMNKSWSQEDMELALDALRNHNMSLTKASATYGIPSTTLWQRAHRMGIDTPKKDGPAKSWTEDVLNVALEALRNGSISANKASKAYGIPSSTLYKIARREGIRLAAPFNASPTTWNPEDLDRALEAIRSGTTTVQKAATEFGIPSGTLYGRCKREGIELSRSNPTPWSEDAMNEALESVRIGQMSINQAAIHYNLPYSSLYGRFKRIKYEADHEHTNEVGSTSDVDGSGAHTPHTPHTPMSGGVPTPHSVHSTHSVHSVHSAHSTTSVAPPTSVPPSVSSVQTSVNAPPPPPQQHTPQPPPPPHPPMPHIQPQIMLLQYQQAPPPPLHMYQPAPS